MPGMIFPSILADLVLPSLQQCVNVVAPIIVLGAAWCLVYRTDEIVHSIFPDLEWEKSLGWLNIKAEKRAKAWLRWLRYGTYFLLLDALVGILWGAKGLHLMRHWTDPYMIGGVMLRIGVLSVCLGIWVFYLGAVLMPRLRAERHEKEFQKFRSHMDRVEHEQEHHPHSRLDESYRRKKRAAPLAPLVPDRGRRRR